MSMPASPTLNVETLKGPYHDQSVIEGYILHRKFLAKVFALAEQNEKLKILLTEKKFYSAEMHAKKKLELIKQNENEFLGCLSDNEIDFLIPNDFRRKHAVFSKKLSETADEVLQKFSSVLVKIKTDLAKTNGNEKQIGKIKEYLNSKMGLLHIFLESEEVNREVNEGITVDLFKLTEEGIINGDRYWKLHVHIDMSAASENHQEKVDQAYNILLHSAKQHGIQTLKLVAPFEKINDMQGREISIYLKGQNTTDKANIKEFMQTIESEFAQRGIHPTRTNHPEANKPISGSQYFSFRNEYSNNNRRYYPGHAAVKLSNLINRHRETLLELYATTDPNTINDCLAQLKLRLNDDELKFLREALSTSKDNLQDMPVEAIVRGPFQEFLLKNTKDLRSFLNSEHAPHNPFELEDVFGLSTMNLTPGPSTSSTMTSPLLPSSSPSNQKRPTPPPHPSINTLLAYNQSTPPPLSPTNTNQLDTQQEDPDAQGPSKKARLDTNTPGFSGPSP